MAELEVTSPSGARVAPGSPSDTSGFVLTPPAAVVVVSDQQAAGAVALGHGRDAELRSKASVFVAELAGLDLRSPAFAEKVSSITSMGEHEMRSAAATSSRLLDRPASALGKGPTGQDAQTRVASTLADLRTTITDLDPKRADLSGVKKLLKWLPGGSKVDRYFARYQSAQSHLDAIIKALASGQDELRKDNAAIETEKANLWTTMGKLSEYNALASALDSSLAGKVAELEAEGSGQDAKLLSSGALLPVRQRRQDIATQLAVNVQGYLALDLVRANNLELIRGVDRAQTTTITALRTAVLVSNALSQQKLVLDQITALNAVTPSLVESATRQVGPQGGQLTERTAGSSLDVAQLQGAFDKVMMSIAALDTFRSQADESMAQTVTALEGQLDRVKVARGRA